MVKFKHQNIYAGFTASPAQFLKAVTEELVFIRTSFEGGVVTNLEEGGAGSVVNVRLRATVGLGMKPLPTAPPALTEDDRALPGDDLRTSHASDVGLHIIQQ